MSTAKITFIGAGNMATSIIGGLTNKGYPANLLTATDPLQDNLHKLQQQYGINPQTDNVVAVADADVVVLAVKPQVLKLVAEALREHLKPGCLVISIAAGINITSISRWLGDVAIVRCMPNTPALVLAGASGLYANHQTTASQKACAEEILNAVGIVQWLDSESLLDPVTAVSGSGPAYFFLMMEAMIDAGIAQGLSREVATELTLQTALGAAMLAQDSDVDVTELRRRVTSPKGTTEQAILSFERDGLREMVSKAMQACTDRSIELAEELGG